MWAPTRLNGRFALFSAIEISKKFRSGQVSGASQALEDRLKSFLTKDIERVSLRLPLLPAFVRLRLRAPAAAHTLGFVVWRTVAMQRMLVAVTSYMKEEGIIYAHSASTQNYL